ncbi:MAG: ABC transporter ATP-binding protein, partial [Planctomycetota bacterium]
MIQIERLNFSVGSFALRDVSLHVAPGEYFVLLGPTGSGKTLLVECLCGLNRIHSGRILIAGADVTHREPRSRDIGYLPQDYALFPHQTVRRNICFGLKKRRLPPAAIRRQVDQLMGRLRLAHLAERFPGKLSGGEKQRVALARALAIRPRVLALDEPVSALDEQTRDDLCRQLKQLQKSTKTTTVHVCHNFVEMLAVADRVGIIEQGRILQVGTPQEVLERPNSTRVARFVQAGNRLSARAEPDGEWVRLACAGGVEFRAPRLDSGCPDGEVVVMVRPESIRLGLTSLENEDLPPGTTIL